MHNNNSIYNNNIINTNLNKKYHQMVYVFFLIQKTMCTLFDNAFDTYTNICLINTNGMSIR